MRQKIHAIAVFHCLIAFACLLLHVTLAQKRASEAYKVRIRQTSDEMSTARSREAEAHETYDTYCLGDGVRCRPNDARKIDKITGRAEPDTEGAGLLKVVQARHAEYNELVTQREQLERLEDKTTPALFGFFSLCLFLSAIGWIVHVKEKNIFDVLYVEPNEQARPDELEVIYNRIQAIHAICEPLESERTHLLAQAERIKLERQPRSYREAEVQATRIVDPEAIDMIAEPLLYDPGPIPGVKRI